jgi:hypothetical protein
MPPTDVPGLIRRTVRSGVIVSREDGSFDIVDDRNPRTKRYLDRACFTERVRDLLRRPAREWRSALVDVPPPPAPPRVTALGGAHLQTGPLVNCVLRRALIEDDSGDVEDISRVVADTIAKGVAGQRVYRCGCRCGRPGNLVRGRNYPCMRVGPGRRFRNWRRSLRCEPRGEVLVLYVEGMPLCQDGRGFVCRRGVPRRNR